MKIKDLNKYNENSEITIDIINNKAQLKVDSEIIMEVSYKQITSIMYEKTIVEKRGFIYE